MSLNDWRHFFPLSSPRKEQEQALDYIVEQFTTGMDYVVAELGTGVGKSAIAVTLARWLRANGQELLDREIVSTAEPQAYILTSQKILQDQYVTDFSNHLVDLRSSSNFVCSWIAGHTCAETLRLREALGWGKDADHGVTCATNGAQNVAPTCPYAVCKRSFKQATTGLTNYSYMLSEAVYVGALQPRELVVFDEAHNIESEVRRWATVAINEKFVVSDLKLGFPSHDTELESWLTSKYVPALSALMSKTLIAIQRRLRTKRFDAKLKSLVHNHELFDKHMCQVNRYLQEKGATVENYVTVWDHGNNGQVVSLKPIDVGKQSRELLLNKGRKRLFMSATILDLETFKRSAGVSPREHIGFVSIPSPFPKQNRPIFFVPVGSMSKRSVDTSTPSLIKTVAELLKVHTSEKGIIHCHTYKIAETLIAALKDPRIVVHRSDDRDVALLRHIESSEPTVLLSPSMTEGIDLCGDRSRFQIICKVPYPYIGDPVIAWKLKHDPRWYRWITARTLVQACGRSIRSNDDSAVTYILDSDWSVFYGGNKSIFPPGFAELLQ